MNPPTLTSAPVNPLVLKDAKRLGEIVVMETGGVGPDIHGHVGLLVSVTDM